MLQLSDIQSSPEELQDYYEQLRAQTDLDIVNVRCQALLRLVPRQQLLVVLQEPL
jgi:hypothetical protein